jgi:hypothetical protein
VKIAVMELEVVKVTLPDWEMFDTIDETTEVVVIDGTVTVTTDEKEVAAADETEAIDEDKAVAVDEAKLIAVNVNPLTESVGIVRPMLDRTTVIIKCYIEIVWLPHIR